MISRLSNLLLSWLAPRRCLFCGGRDGLSESDGMGAHRHGSASKAPKGRVDDLALMLCEKCQQSLPWARPSPLCTAPLYYQGQARIILRRFKFHRKEWLAEPLGLLMAQAAADAGLQGDCVTYVPSSWFRAYRRGYQQTKLLAKHTARALSLPVIPLLRKTRQTKLQTSMTDDKARFANMQNAYEALRLLQGERVLLVDDIYTSGATITACRDALLRAGAAEVLPLVAARRPSPLGDGRYRKSGY